MIELSEMNATEYKKYHEAFMENNHGTTALNTFSFILFTVLCTLYCSINGKNRVRYHYIYEYIVIVSLLITAQIFLAEYIYFLNLILFIDLFYKVMFHIHKFDVTRTFSMPNSFNTKYIGSISCMRGLTYLITVFCILAVDFKDFPRYLAKTERYGYSLMDTGVGLFVLMSGLVHKDINKDNYVRVIKGNIKLCTILVTLGVARFVSVKQLDYQEHVTEYGVHWNFFFTLAVCKLLSTVFMLCSKNSLLISILTLAVHEFLLYNGLQDWVFGDVFRTDLLTANREGVVSSLGYVSMYIFAAHMKKELSNNSVPRYVILTRLVVGAMSLWTLSHYVNIHRPTSRTLANAGYCIYIEAILLTVVSVMYFLEVVFQDKEKELYFNVPTIISAINDNGLVYFLAANILTGFVNLSMRTLLLSSGATFLILNLYMMSTIGLTLFLSAIGIKV